MQELVLHIGLPKSGSTTIQERLLALLPGNLGEPRTDEWSRILRRDLVALLKQPRSGRDLEAGAIDWIRTLDRVVPRADAVQDRLVFSEEMLTRPSFYFRTPSTPRYVDNIHPVVTVIGAIRRCSIDRFSRVRVLICLRRQDQFLASYYAQSSNRLPFAGQADFERRVIRLLQDDSLQGRRYLDWASLVQQLWSVVGRENVQVVFLENMATDEYWHDVFGFVGRAPGPDELNTAPWRNIQDNARNLGDDTWSVRSLAPLRLIGSRSNGALPPRANVQYPVVVRSLLRAEKLIARRRTNIVLRRSISESIMSSCSPFNTSLSVELDFDLSKLGYHP